MGAPVMQPARHAAALVLRNAARAHASVMTVLTPGADGTPPRHRPKGMRPRSKRLPLGAQRPTYRFIRRKIRTQACGAPQTIRTRREGLRMRGPGASFH